MPAWASENIDLRPVKRLEARCHNLPLPATAVAQQLRTESYSVLQSRRITDFRENSEISKIRQHVFQQLQVIPHFRTARLCILQKKRDLEDEKLRASTARLLS